MNLRVVISSLCILAVIVVVSLVSILVTNSKQQDQRAQNGNKAPSGCFRAAVLDHVQQNNFTNRDRQFNIELNLDVYANAAKVAASEGSNIIVFPENGIIFGLTTRQDALQFGEPIPNGQSIICNDNKNAKNMPILFRLSCMAKTNRIYLAADLIDRQPCQAPNTTTKTTKCPTDKSYLFNTAVLFDPTGNLLAKYHKMQLFGEILLNVPPKDELVVVETEIGRLGMQICFDMIFNKPGHYLASRHEIDTLLFPTWWFDELPFLGSSQHQMAWAFGNHINLLASNIHKVEVGSMGSGLYSGINQQFVTVNTADRLERLIIANLPINAKTKNTCELQQKVILVDQKVPAKPEPIKYRYQQMSLENVKLVPLTLASSSPIRSCSGGVCCELEFKMDKTTLTNQYEGFYLIVSNRTRPGQYPWTEEFCALVHCPKQPARTECSQYLSDAELKARFFYAKLTAQVGPTTTVYPSAIGSKHEVLTPLGRWRFVEPVAKKSAAGRNAGSTTTNEYSIVFGDKSSSATKSYPLATLGLYGRVYGRDPPYVLKAIPIKL